MTRASMKPVDPLERHYTPDRLAELCASVIVEHMGRRPALAIEPSVGGGAFVRAMPGTKWWAFDIDPDAKGFSCANGYVQDFATATRDTAPGAELVAGNPPFSTALSHVQVARSNWPEAWLAMILPLTHLGIARWQPALSGLYALHPILPRPWGASVRETALFVWSPVGGDPTPILGQPVRWK